jgi:glutathione S-transferase
MLKLYYSPGACSLSPHIVLCEAGLNFDVEQVDLGKKTTAGGTDFLTINPKGYVPALLLDNGEILTEGPPIVQYLADLVPAKGLAPAAGTIARLRLQEWLNFISTELHKSFSPLFAPHTPEATKLTVHGLLARRFAYLASQLEGKQFLLGDTFTVADAYLFVVLSWAPYVGVDLSPWPILAAYSGRIATRPAVQAALRAEGLLKD